MASAGPVIYLWALAPLAHRDWCHPGLPSHMLVGKASRWNSARMTGVAQANLWSLICIIVASRQYLSRTSPIAASYLQIIQL